MRKYATNMRDLINLLESEDSRVHTGFHVTSAAAARDILRHGFRADHRDVGGGIYFWKSIERARRYAANGGWDELLKDPVIIEVHDCSLQEIDHWDINADWSAADYKAIPCISMDEDNQGSIAWRPASMRMVE